MTGSHPRLRILNQPAPTPVAHSQPPELPIVFEAELDEATYQSLMRDLREVASVQEVRIKTGQASTATERDYALDEAREMFERREAYGIQVIYTHEDELWCDTLLGGVDRVHLLRMRALPDTTEHS